MWETMKMKIFFSSSVVTKQEGQRCSVKLRDSCGSAPFFSTMGRQSSYQTFIWFWVSVKALFTVKIFCAFTVQTCSGLFYTLYEYFTMPDIYSLYSRNVQLQTSRVGVLRLLHKSLIQHSLFKWPTCLHVIQRACTEPDIWLRCVESVWHLKHVRHWPFGKPKPFVCNVSRCQGRHQQTADTNGKFRPF